LMGACWEFVRLKAPGKSYLADHDQSVCDDYVEWLFGQDVYECVVRDSRKEIIYKPAWNKLLDLDLQVRKLAYKWIHRDGVTIKEALKQAMEDEKTYRKYFTLPVRLSVAALADRHTKADSSRGRPRTPRRDGGAKGWQRLRRHSQGIRWQVVEMQELRRQGHSPARPVRRRPPRVTPHPRWPPEALCLQPRGLDRQGLQASPLVPRTQWPAPCPRVHQCPPAFRRGGRPAVKRHASPLPSHRWGAPEAAAPGNAAEATEVTPVTATLHNRVLFLFAGESRLADMGAAFPHPVAEEIARGASRKILLEMEEMGIAMNVIFFDRI
jgi:hypothetical protein